jgi:4a-hydroxytetrahydrobiopterin dehydratase
MPEALPPEALSPEAVEAALAEAELLDGWQFRDHTLEKAFTFADFRAAFAWMTAVAFEAEALGHHPDWQNVYRTVRVRLTTHDADDRVTQLDLDLATAMNRLAATAR